MGLNIKLNINTLHIFYIIMAHFIELTDINDAKIVVNIDNVLWFEQYDDDSSLIYFSLDGRNDVPFNMIVKESQKEILKKL